jgi:hypothetical protein
VAGATYPADGDIAVKVNSVEVFCNGKLHKVDGASVSTVQSSTPLGASTTFAHKPHNMTLGAALQDDSVESDEESTYDPQMPARLAKLDYCQLMPDGYLVPDQAPVNPELSELMGKEGFFPEPLHKEFLEFLDKETPGILSTGEYDMGCHTPSFSIEPELIDDTPIRCRPFRLNSVHQDIVSHYMEQLVDCGAFAYAESANCSPLFVVAKAPHKDLKQS